MRKIIKVAVNSIYIIAILISVLIIYSTISTGIPSILGYRPMFVVSESMEPVIKKYQFILGEVAEIEELKVGDIVGFKAPKKENALNSKLVVHRIVAINDDNTFFLQGDANLSSLEYERKVNPEDILYKIIIY